MTRLSVVIPAKNELEGLKVLIPDLLNEFGNEIEVIVVDDGSDDSSAEFLEKHNIKLITHPYSMGNGAAIKAGARAAASEVILFMDADGQHKADDVKRLVEKYNEGYDMVVGARGSGSQASWARLVANGLYNKLSSWMVAQKIPDLTSGFRIVNAKLFKEFISLLPNGFSYPTTITMAFFRAGYKVGYIPIIAERRMGKSHIKFNDGVKFLLIIFKIGTLYSPLKIFFPVSLLFMLTGLAYYGYTYFVLQRFTNMSALMFSTSIIIMMIGLVSEQITNLMYSKQS